MVFLKMMRNTDTGRKNREGWLGTAGEAVSHSPASAVNWKIFF